MWTLYITLLVFQQGTGQTVITKQEVNNIVSSDECEKAAHEWRLQAVAAKTQVMTVCIKRSP